MYYKVSGKFDHIFNKPEDCLIFWRNIDPPWPLALWRWELISLSAAVTFQNTTEKRRRLFYGKRNIISNKHKCSADFITFLNYFCSPLIFFLLSMHNTSTYKQTGLLSSESSDSDTDEESLFGPPSGRSQWENHQSRSRTADLWASSNRPSESIRRGSDRELQAFINMRDQADKATEVIGTGCWAQKIRKRKTCFYSKICNCVFRVHSSNLNIVYKTKVKNVSQLGS